MPSLKTRRDYQVPCPACRARTSQPCHGKEGQRLPGVHFQRTTALRQANLAAIRALYAPAKTCGTMHQR